MEKERGLFESVGNKIDSKLSSLREGTLDFMSSLFEEQEQQNDVTQSEHSPELTIVKTFLNGLGSDVELQVVDSDFTYKDILVWARKHFIGDEMYMIRYNETTHNNTLICVFFAQNGKPLLQPHHAKICYAFKKLPESLSNIFGNKNMYIQPIKK
ncbi:MAG: hypothetical protein SOT07_09300 [Paludibacteraceae bacterium]|nr:hypothetical protein [Paludibacteraceae bacterium]